MANEAVSSLEVSTSTGVLTGARDRLRGLRAILDVSAATMATSALGFAYWALAARLFPLGAIGSSSVLISTAMLIGLFGKLGFDILLARGGLTRESAWPALRPILVATGVASTLLGLGAALGNRTSLVGEGLTVLLAVSIAWSLVLDGLFIGLGRTRAVLGRAILVGSARLAFLGLAFVPSLPFPIVLGWLVSNAVVTAAVLIAFRQASSDARPTGSIRSLLHREMILNYLSAGFLLAPGLLFPLLIERLVGAEDAGRFYFVWMIVALFHAVPNALGQVHLRAQERKTNSLLPAALTLALVVGFAIAGRWLLRLLAGGDLEAQLPLVLAFGVVAILACFASARVARLRAESHWPALMALSLTFLALVLAVSAAALRAWGLWAILAGWALGQVFLLAGGSLLVRHRSGQVTA